MDGRKVQSSPVVALPGLISAAGKLGKWNKCCSTGGRLEFDKLRVDYQYYSGRSHARVTALDSNEGEVTSDSPHTISNAFPFGMSLVNSRCLQIKYQVE